MKVDPINDFVAAQIASHRVQSGVRVIDLARGAGIPLGTVSNHLTGHCRLSLINLYRLLSCLALDIREVWPETSTRPGEPVTEESILEGIRAAKARIIAPLSLDDVLKAVIRVYRVSRAELCSPSRRRLLSEARAVATQIVAEQPHLRLISLSVLLRRDVSSLSHCLRRMKKRLACDRQLQERLEAVRQVLDCSGKPGRGRFLEAGVR